jgi:hypothetical protein
VVEVAAGKRVVAASMRDGRALVDEVGTGPVQAHIGVRPRMAQMAALRNIVDTLCPRSLRPVRCCAPN